jgi:hypothetical protein
VTAGTVILMDERRRALSFAEELAAACSELLGDLLVAVILHGSLVLGSYTPDRSDIDLLVVVKRRLGDDVLAALEGLVVGRQAIAPSGVDFRVVTRAVAGSPTRSPAMELYVGLRTQEAPEIETRVAGEPDLVVEFSMVRAGGRSLVGDEPRSVVGGVPDEWVVAYGDEIIARWQGLTDDAEHAELMVLTTCRVWRFAIEGVYCSKAEAGQWALARDPLLVAVEAALRRRAGETDQRVEPQDIGHLLKLVRAEIAPHPTSLTRRQ